MESTNKNFILNLKGQERYFVPFFGYGLFFRVKITDAKRKFGHILVKIEPEISKLLCNDKNFAWVRLETLKVDYPWSEQCIKKEQN